MSILLRKKTIKKLGYYPQVRSQHPTHDVLRHELAKLPFRSVVRLGSTTDLEDTVDNGGNRIECNTVEGVGNSSNKLLMKKCFTKANLNTATWYTANRPDNFSIHANNGEGQLISVSTGINQLSYPIIAKHIRGSRGRGNTKLDTQEQLTQWLVGKTLSNYIFEKYYSYNREYRLHVTADGCFYTCRKVLKPEIPSEQRWVRNDSTCNWLIEDNESFDKPSNWSTIVDECVKALEALKLDIAGFDVKVQSTKNDRGIVRPDPKFIILESNSACSFSDITAKKYMEIIPIVLTKKYELWKNS